VRSVPGMVAFLAILGLPLIGQADSVGERLSADQIRAQFVGNTEVGSVEGFDFVRYNAPDGASTVRVGNVVDRGAYRVTSDGRSCTRWHKFNGQAEACYRIYRHGDTFYTIDRAGGIRATFKLIPGNPYHL